jgi:hypothetical protein
MNENEKRIVDLLVSRCGIEDLKVARKSDRECDLILEGRYGKDYPYMGDVAFSAWLPLFAIRELTPWTSEAVASLTDHPNMAAEGDWSGVRDSDPDTIWFIFERFV